MTVRIIVGDALEELRKLPARSVHCCVTSPPYWGLRAYAGDPGMIGLEPTFTEHLEHLVAVFREVRRVLRKDGTVWLNYGDAYAGGGRGKGSGKQTTNEGSNLPPFHPEGFKPKDLLMMPARVAMALQADGWWLRSEIVWHKPNPMPESVTDRPTNSHEKLFLLSKSARYFYDAEAVRSTSEHGVNASAAAPEHPSYRPPRPSSERVNVGANLRNVWKIATHSFKGAHFATFPPKLVEPCIKAGTSEKGACPECGAPWVRVVEKKRVPVQNGRNTRIYERSTERKSDDARDIKSAGAEFSYQVTTTGWRPTCEHDADPVPCTVLDPFGGAGTVGLVADRLGRDAVLIEISPEYAEMGRRRIEDDAPLFATDNITGETDDED